MNQCDNNNCPSCISNIIQKILLLQKQNFGCDNYVGCDKPFLGPSITSICYNTRPIQLFIAGNGDAWTFSYTLEDGTTGTSDILRIESLDDCCCTCRILIFDPTTNTYSSTNQFVTIDLNSCGAIRCFNDVAIDLN